MAWTEIDNNPHDWNNYAVIYASSSLNWEDAGADWTELT